MFLKMKNEKKKLSSLASGNLVKCVDKERFKLIKNARYFFIYFKLSKLTKHNNHKIFALRIKLAL